MLCLGTRADIARHSADSRSLAWSNNAAKLPGDRDQKGAHIGGYAVVLRFLSSRRPFSAVCLFVAPGGADTHPNGDGNAIFVVKALERAGRRIRQTGRRVCARISKR